MAHPDTAAETEDTARGDSTIARLRAELAARGWVSHIVGLSSSDILFSVHRWGMFREITGVEALAAFVESLGPRPPLA